MHDPVTTSSTATRTYYSASPDLNRPQTADTIGWSNTNETLDNWHLSNETTPVNLSSTRRTPLQNLALPSTTRMESTSSKGENPSDRTPGAPGTNRWRFNGNGQLIDSEAVSAGWDLADDMVRMKIGEVGSDVVEDVHSQIRTPPKSQMAAVAVAQMTEASPLDTSSNASVDSSPHASDHQISISHSRGSSTDSTLSSSHDSTASNTLLAPSQAPLKLSSVGEVKERPHSFSGGLSSADLRRLQQAGDAPGINVASDVVLQQQQQQQQQWASTQYRETIGPNDKQFPPEQLSYPSLANQAGSAQRSQPPQSYDYRSGPTPTNMSANRDELQIDYNLQQRNFNPLPQGPSMGSVGSGSPSFVPGRPNNAVGGMAYRQPPRGFPQPGLIPSPTALGYPGGHTSHLSLGNTQQLYDMMLPGPPHEGHHPAVARVQQQHNVFRATHHHSASDPSAIRDAATLALLNSNLQAFNPGMFPPGMAPPMPPTAMPLYPNQYYGAQDAYARPDVAAVQAMAAARLQSQYTGPYGVLPPQALGMDSGLTSPSSASGQSGPSANNRKLGLYKTELCRSWEEKGTCRYGAKCQFAHGEDELRKVARHPKYKTEICRTYFTQGSCPYGKRCCFIHTGVPGMGQATAGGTPSATDTAPPQPRPEGRPRSLSTNSDPNDASVSLLARISAKRNQDGVNNASTPVDLSPSNFQFARPPTGSLRVDTSALEGASLKQNKSAYPSFASNGILMPAPEHISAKSPAPVTAGPDLGRHNNSRLEIVGYNNARAQHKSSVSNSSIRHSFNGSDVDLNFAPSPSVSGQSTFPVDSSSNAAQVPRVNGHVRAGSAGNWGTFARSSHLASPYPHSTSAASEIPNNMPWSTSELAVGSSRLNEKAWA